MQITSFKKLNLISIFSTNKPSLPMLKPKKIMLSSKMSHKTIKKALTNKTNQKNNQKINKLKKWLTKNKISLKYNKMEKKLNKTRLETLRKGKKMNKIWKINKFVY